VRWRVVRWRVSREVEGCEVGASARDGTWLRAKLIMKPTLSPNRGTFSFTSKPRHVKRRATRSKRSSGCEVEGGEVEGGEVEGGEVGASARNGTGCGRSAGEVAGEHENYIRSNMCKSTPECFHETDPSPT
jgi:hypothetical protein